MHTDDGDMFLVCHKILMCWRQKHLLDYSHLSRLLQMCLYLISNPTWILGKNLNSLRWSAILGDFKNQADWFGILKSRIIADRKTRRRRKRRKTKAIEKHYAFYANLIEEIETVCLNKWIFKYHESFCIVKGITKIKNKYIKNLIWNFWITKMKSKDNKKFQVFSKYIMRKQTP